MSKKLTREQLKHVKAWLHVHNVPYKNLSRDFSDGLLMAKLLKKLCPKLVDLHNYPAINKAEFKQSNWETLNQKVLNKLNLQQNPKVLEKLAKGEPGAIEAVLLSIMLIDTKNNSGDRWDDITEQLCSENNEVRTVTIRKVVGDALVEVPQKMISYDTYQKVQRLSQMRDEILTASHQEIARLENVVKVKDELIDELCSQLAKLSTTDNEVPLKVNTVEETTQEAAHNQNKHIKFNV